MKITKRQLRRIIKEELGGRKLHTAMGDTAQADEFSTTRDNLLGIVELMDPIERKFVIDGLIDDLMSLKDI